MLNIQTLRYPKKGKGTLSVELSDDLVLAEDCSYNAWIVPKGTVIKTKVTENFGWVILPINCKDRSGNIIPRRLFKY